MNESRRGLAHGIAAYGLWGIAPLYWKLFDGVSPAEILAHRVLWGLLACAAIAGVVGAAPAVRAAFADRRTLGAMAISAVLLAINWGCFIGAVAAGRILEASLGYFINPLLSVGLGTLVLGERLRRLQWVAIGLAVIGVTIRAWDAGRLPWISIVIAATFAGYGLVRKVARVESLAGSTVETALLAPIAIGYLAHLAIDGSGQLGHTSPGIELLVLSTGVVTAVPLLLFSSAARRLPLSTVGFLQFLAPTTQFVLAVALYHEPFAREQLVAFGLIWLGLAAFSLDLIRRPRVAPGLQPISQTGR